jgi:signal transduction histidine kinase
MSSLTRLLTLSLLLLTLLVIVGLASQSWIKRQDQRVGEVARAQLSAQLQAAVEVTRQAGADWDDRRLREVSALIGTSLRYAERTEDRGSASALEVSAPLDDGRALVASRPIWTSDLAHTIFQRVIIGLGVFALILAAVLVFAVVFFPSQTSETRSPFLTRAHDIRSLSTLARTSVRQQVELDQERDERQRAEAEARQRLQLLNQALEEKIHIGRDLHDGVIQSLYAAGLTLESARQLASTKPEVSTQQIDSTLDLINRTIRDIRDYISGLSATKVRSNSISQALREVVADLRAGRPTDIEVNIDEATAAQLSDSQTSETIQIVREAVSNALRHGGAQHIIVQLTSADARAELDIRDDGTGFDDKNTSPTGHGLANMRARALSTGGSFYLSSTPGHGTTIRINWAIPFAT